MNASLAKLKERVLVANRELVRRGLVLYTWGNASGCDRQSSCIVIKPSGVDLSALSPEEMSVVSLHGEHLDGLLPSSDTGTHLTLYRAWDSVGGIVHTHSRFATAWAQAARELPCLGTTHADCFAGSVPCTRALTPQVIANSYEEGTGLAMVEAVLRNDPLHIPAVLVARHGPFAWGADVETAVHNAVVLEEIAAMAIQTLLINPNVSDMPTELMERHFRRKHGDTATYGQAVPRETDREDRG